MQFKPTFVLTLLCLVAPLLATGQTAKPKDKGKSEASSNPDKYFEQFPYSKKLLTEEDQIALGDMYGEFPGGLAEYARAIIFGKHGRVFVDSNIKQVLGDKKWYKPNPHFSNAMLNATERANLDIVREIESGMHDRVMPGDLRWWRDQDIKKDDLVDASIVEMHIMRAEIEAVHGRTFPEEPLVQKYFNERYWYQPSPHYDPKSLNAHERANIALLSKIEAKRLGHSLVPGAMIAYGEKLIKPAMLKDLNLYDLRLLRNEIYAIRGGRFRTQWLQDHFDAEDWYTPLPKGEDPKLTAIDQKNVALIVKQENELHSALSTAKVKPSDLKGMLSDDAGRLRNEIYARRGKVFKDKWLQGYFASMSWYKANPLYSDRLLSSIERENIKTIAKYQDKARTDEQNMAEG